MGDLRKSHLLDASITGMVVKKHSSPEGAYYPLYQTEVCSVSSLVGRSVEICLSCRAHCLSFYPRPLCLFILFSVHRHPYTHMNTHTHTDTHTHTYTHTHTAPPYEHTRNKHTSYVHVAHAQTHACTHTHTFMHTHMHKYTHKNST